MMVAVDSVQYLRSKVAHLKMVPATTNLYVNTSRMFNPQKEYSSKTNLYININTSVTFKKRTFSMEKE